MPENNPMNKNINLNKRTIALGTIALCSSLAAIATPSNCWDNCFWSYIDCIVDADVGENDCRQAGGTEEQCAAAWQEARNACDESSEECEMECYC